MQLDLRVLTRNEETQIAITQDSSNTDQTRTTTGYNAHILPSILAFTPFSVVLVVQRSNRLSQRPDTSCRTVFPAMSADVDFLRSLKASFYAVVDLGCALSQVCPFFGVFEEAVL